MHSKLHQKRQAGLSLVELLVAITLGLFLSFGAVQAFLSGKKAYTMQESLSRIQETGRLAQEFINFDIRRAGDYGCSSGEAFAAAGADDVAAACGSSTGINMLNTPSDSRYNFSYPVYGYNNITSTTAAYLSPAPVPTTDVLIMHTGQDIGVLTTAVAAGATLGTLAVDTNSGIAPGSPSYQNVVAVGGCAGMRVFQLSASAATTLSVGGSTPGNRCTTTTTAFPQASQVRLLDTYYYYVGTNATTGRKSLYRQTLSHVQPNTAVASDEILEGVEDMQVSYGVDTNGDNLIDSWLDAGSVTTASWNSWDKGYCTNGGTLNTCTVAPTTNQDQTKAVRAVRYSLLIASTSPVLDAEQQYSYNGSTYYGGNATAGSGDKRLRQIFTSTVAIRSMQQTQ